MSADAGDVVLTPGIWKDVMESFISFPSLFYYCFIVFMCGLLTSFHWSFFFWFLERIQPKDTLLMGESSRPHDHHPHDDVCPSS